jgi:hypothetical protein
MEEVGRNGKGKNPEPDQIRTEDRAGSQMGIAARRGKESALVYCVGAK